MNGVSYIAECMVQVPITHSKRRLWMERHVGPIHMICVWMEFANLQAVTTCLGLWCS